MQNVFDEDPPFVGGAFENGYDESLATIKGRFWYVQLKKRFWQSEQVRSEIKSAARRAVLPKNRRLSHGQVIAALAGVPPAFTTKRPTRLC